LGDGELAEDEWEGFVHRLASTSGREPGHYIHSVRLAVSGRSVGPGFYSLLAVLGRDRILLRLRRFLGTEASQLGRGT
jgi:glutamyl-tRNA synthetase